MTGQFYWPPAGNPGGHGWAELQTATGQNLVAIDTRAPSSAPSCGGGESTDPEYRLYPGVGVA
jgi:hypothetical protein